MIKISTHDRYGEQEIPMMAVDSWPEAALIMLGANKPTAYLVAVEWQGQTIIGQPLLYVTPWARTARVRAPFESNRIDKAGLLALSKLAEIIPVQAAEAA